ncbi:hypothetical protein D3C71_2168020 [compost metagenome]
MLRRLARRWKGMPSTMSMHAFFLSSGTTTVGILSNAFRTSFGSSANATLQTFNSTRSSCSIRIESCM